VKSSETDPGWSRRSSRIRPFIVMEVFERAAEIERAGQSIVHLEVGEPDFETPEAVREAGVRALRDGRTHYTPSLGRPELRETIAAWHEQRYGIATSPGDVIVTVGSSGAMLLVFAALLDAGDEVLLPDPGYPCYPKFVLAFDGIPVGVPVREEDDFAYDPGLLGERVGSRTRAIVVNSPSNPTGTVASPDNLRTLAETFGRRVSIVSDEIYHGLVYEGEARSMREYLPRAVVINGFSKLFAMTGWRLGYAIVPADMIRTLQRLQQNLFISAPDFAQVAAVAALTEAAEDVERMRLEYDRRRRFLLEALTGMGLRVAGRPAGAFYVLLNVSEFADDVYRFAFEILEEAGVALTPGVDFGDNGAGYLRLCYANSMDKLADGVHRLARFFDRRR
jgi:(5-formylfuran-3-yl)methyl phosphate transaminase